MERLAVGHLIIAGFALDRTYISAGQQQRVFLFSNIDCSSVEMYFNNEQFNALLSIGRPHMRQYQ